MILTTKYCTIRCNIVELNSENMDNSTESNSATGSASDLQPENQNTEIGVQNSIVTTEPESGGFAKPDPEKNGHSIVVTKPSVVPPVEVKPISKVERTGSKRLTITVNFSLDEVPYMNEIIQARIDSKLSKNASHFIRQCVDFAIHHKAGTKIAIPDITPVEIKDGFYHPSK